MTKDISRILESGKAQLADRARTLPPAFQRQEPVRLAHAPWPGAPLNISAGLEPFESPLDAQTAGHLLRRTQFGAPIDQINGLIGTGASDAVDGIIAAALDTTATPFPEKPAWADEIPPFNGTQEEIDAFVANNIAWLYEFQDEWFALLMSVGLRERMTLFWHNHFATQYDDYFLAMHAYRYLKLMRENAFGNLKDFVRAVGKDPAMLEYLDGNTNRVGEPNENYGRELLELFTMSPKDSAGNDNYSQQDIVEAARALTGWIIDYINHVGVFNPSRFDDGEKTILGQTGNWGYDDVVDIIFQERGTETAYFICEKLYKEFVYAVPDPVIVDELAQDLLIANFEIEPVLTRLLKSAHFFDAAVIGAQLKSPIAMVTGMPVDVGQESTPEQLAFLRLAAIFLQQDLLNPPNVAGWPGYRTWISTTSLPIRLLLSDLILFGNNGEDLVDMTPIVAQLPGANSPNAAFELPVALASYLLPVPLDTLDIGTVTEVFGGDLVNFPIPEEVLNGPAYAIDLAKIFLAGVPWYEWDLSADIAPILLALYARFLTQRPEFQLA
ncbi:MAG: DUF1800 domain-containing protein [Bacteroidota bacterium]